MHCVALLQVLGHCCCGYCCTHPAPSPTVAEQRLNRGFPEDAPVVIYKLRKEVCPRVWSAPDILEGCCVVFVCSIQVAVATLLSWLFTPCHWSLSGTSASVSWGQMVHQSNFCCLFVCLVVFVVCFPSMTKQ